MAETSAGVVIEFDPPSIIKVWRLKLFPALLAAHLEVAMQESVDLLDNFAHTFVPYPGNDASGRSTGVLESSIQGDVTTPFLGVVSTGEIEYAQRVEYGFSGRTDSLGRHYVYWPDARYFAQSIDAGLDEVAMFFDEAQMDAAAEVGFF